VSIFQIVDAGELCGPLINHAPHTLFFFVGIVFSIDLLILNLVLAVVVERATLQHDQDVKAEQEKAEKETFFGQARLGKALEVIDTDKSGTISAAELQDGFINDPNISAHIKTTGVTQSDLNNLFEAMDEDKNGELPFRSLCSASTI